MSLLHRVFISSFVIASFALPTVAAPKKKKTPQRKYQICTMTLGAARDRKVFESYLKKQNVSYTELTSFSPKPGEKMLAADIAGYSWFKRACESGIQCDALVITGHLTEDIYSRESKFHLRTDEAEDRMCDRTCEGILNHPKEVYLLGANTKPERGTAPVDWKVFLQKLTNDGIVSTDAQKITLARYGAFWDDTREKLQRIFSDVPNVYGFDMIGPGGQIVKNFLDTKFKENPNYGQTLYSIEVDQIFGDLKKVSGELKNLNDPYQAEAIERPVPQSEGRHRESICQLRNDSLQMRSRLDMANYMVESPDRRAYLRSVIRFLIANREKIKEAEEAGSEEFGKLSGDKRLQSLLAVALRRTQGTYVQMAEVLKAQVILGIKPQEQASAELKTAMKPALKKLNRESVDQIYLALGQDGILKINVTLDDFEPSQLQTALGAIAIAAFSTNDARITAEVLKMFNSPIAPEYTSAAIAGLRHLPGYTRDIVQISQRYVDTAVEPLAAQGFGNVLSHAKPEEVVPAIRKAIPKDKTGLILYRVYELIEQNQLKNEQIASDLANLLTTMTEAQAQFILPSIAMVASVNSRVWDKHREFFEKMKSAYKDRLIQQFAYEVDVPSSITDLAIARAYEVEDRQIIALLTKSHLSQEQADKIFKLIMKKPKSASSDYFRTLLRSQSQLTWRDEQTAELAGPDKPWICERQNKKYSCVGE